MAVKRLNVLAHPRLHHVRMVLGFDGWMDGGEVSTGTVETLIRKLDVRPLATIDPDDLYIESFPGSMEISAMFRPFCKVVGGLITEYRAGTNAFYYSEADSLILFLGKEPNIHWAEFSVALFELAKQFDVEAIYFVGSVAGLVPHTREPRLYGSVSHPEMRPLLQKMGVRFSNYEGPASITTYLTHRAPDVGVRMLNLVAEIPAYVQGRNFRCIESVTRHLAGILNLTVNLDDLRGLADRLEERLNEIVRQRDELQTKIQSLEEDYDNEVFDTQMTDMKDWLEKQGIRLD